jgi:hypothetical protein
VLCRCAGAGEGETLGLGEGVGIFVGEGVSLGLGEGVAEGVLLGSGNGPICRCGCLGAFLLLDFARFFRARRCFPRLPVLAAYVVAGSSAGTLGSAAMGVDDGG